MKKIEQVKKTLLTKIEFVKKDFESLRSSALARVAQAAKSASPTYEIEMAAAYSRDAQIKKEILEALEGVLSNVEFIAQREGE